MLSVTATRPAVRVSEAQAAQARGPFSPFTDKLFRTGLGRLPTATERRDVEGLAAKLSARGAHIFEVGAYLSHLMTRRPDFRARNPHAATFERVYQHDLGRPPNLDEYNKLTSGTPDSGTPDAGPFDAGPDDGGCRLPSDFPKDAGFLEQAACQCLFVPILHCFEENGPRCFSWACPPQKAPDGGYVYLPDGGVQCLC